VSLGNGITELPIFAFLGCYSLKEITIPASIQAINEGAFYYCYQLAKINTGRNVKFIANEAFSKCSRLKEAIVGDNVNVVSEWAFRDCVALEKLTLGERVDSVASLAFDGCKAIKSITVKAENPPLLPSADCFPENIYHQATLYVPEISQMDYYLCDVWTLFEHQEVITDTSIPGDVNGDGEITIADVNVLINGILDVSSVEGSMDVNDDGEVTIADVNVLIDLILQESA
jgi:hypothetical protein